MPRHATISKTYRFEAAHHLPNHGGPCANPHGHSYRVDVRVLGQLVESPGASDEGMVLDFWYLDEVMRPVIGGLDHTDLADPESYAQQTLRVGRTTAENLVWAIWGAVHQGIKNQLMGTSRWRVAVRVWETEKAWAECGGDV